MVVLDLGGTGGHSHCKGMGKLQRNGSFGDVTRVWEEMKSLFYATISVPRCLAARSHSETSSFCFVPMWELLSQGHPLYFWAAARPETASPQDGWVSVLGGRKPCREMMASVAGVRWGCLLPSSSSLQIWWLIWKSNFCFLPRLCNPFFALFSL